VVCQLCDHEGHTIQTLYKHFDRSFTGFQENKSALSTTVSYGVDTNWYTNTGATDHITGELEKLTMRDKYNGNDQVHTASGASMEIDQIGHSFVRTPTHPLHRIMFSMFQRQTKISSQSIDLLKIITPS
jgi:hypothetical protein